MSDKRFAITLFGYICCGGMSVYFMGECAQIIRIIVCLAICALSYSCVILVPHILDENQKLNDKVDKLEERIFTMQKMHKDKPYS